MARHFHSPNGSIKGQPNDGTRRLRNGDRTSIGSHTGTVTDCRPYGTGHDYPGVNLPQEPQDPSFQPSVNDVVIKPDEPHNYRNPFPSAFVHTP